MRSTRTRADKVQSNYDYAISASSYESDPDDRTFHFYEIDSVTLTDQQNLPKEVWRKFLDWKTGEKIETMTRQTPTS